MRRSKNQITINQLNLACRQAVELRDAAVSENLAIRTIELFSDVYAKLLCGGSATPHHVDEVKLWSIAALALRKQLPNAKPRDHLRVEHGTPKRAFARMTLELHLKQSLDETSMGQLVAKYWKLAVITIEEDRRLNETARSKVFDTPEER